MTFPRGTKLVKLPDIFSGVREALHCEPRRYLHFCRGAENHRFWPNAGFGYQTSADGNSSIYVKLLNTIADTLLNPLWTPTPTPYHISLTMF
jgi:hypothetical protein